MTAARQRLVVSAALAAVAVAIAWTFAATVLAHTPRMGLPLDDSYIYLTYAKQFGRGEPFSYYPGGGYSAGSTSVLWPMLLAPFWALGARGHALVWVSFGLCAALYAATAVGAYHVVRRIAGELAGVCAGALVLAVSAFAWTALSGMEVAFASALLVATILVLQGEPATGPPRARLVACLAALSLSRPEATVLVVAVVAACAWQRRRAPRAAAWWLAPLLPAVAWLVANRALAGHWFPNTGVVKSHFYLPGFTWSYWFDAVAMQLGAALRGLFVADGPLGPTRLYTPLFVVGAVRVVRWARASGHRLVGALLVAGPFALLGSVIATSASPWSFQGYRYVAPMFPLIAMVAGCALAPVARVARRAWTAGAIAVVAAIAAFAIRPFVDDARFFAQGATDTNTQVVAIGTWLADHRPDARVMFHDAGAIAYYGDTEVFDMLGLVTNHQAGVANNGPGARFEELESLPADRRPTLFAYYPSWLGTSELYGDVLMRTPYDRKFLPDDRDRLAGDSDMQVIVAAWDHVGTAERPLEPHPGWAMVDRVDIADLDSERAHGWRGALGARRFGDPTARWSFVEREVGPHGLAIDGGRTIRDGSERFTVAVAAGVPVRLVLRTGGGVAPPYQDRIERAAHVAVRDEDGDELAHATIAPPNGRFVEIAFEVAATDAKERTFDVTADGPYRAFHWFVLQPE